MSEAFETPLFLVRDDEATTILAKVRAFHDAWGNTDTEVEELNPQRLWEQLDQIINGEPT